MPEIARFWNFVIFMYPNDHEPPHFHVFCSGARAKIMFMTGEFVVLHKKISVADQRNLRKWAKRCQSELLAAWVAVRNRQDPKPITLLP
jgi:hypothetical protein